MGTKNNPGEFDCHAKAGPDEPIFTLRAKDPLAPLLVRRWAYLFRSARREKNEKGNLELNAANHRKYMEAHDCADAMERWRKEHVPDEPEPVEKPESPEKPQERSDA